MSKTQNQRIVDKLLSNHGYGITSLEAARMEPPIMRLSERIRELKADGIKFYHTDEKTTDGKCKYTRYHLLSLENYHPRGEAPDTRLEAIQEQYTGADNPWADAKHDAQLARL